MPTKERTQQFRKIVQNYSRFISVLEQTENQEIYLKYWRIFIDDIVRKKIDYSNKTWWKDIRLRILREHKRQLNNKNVLP